QCLDRKFYGELQPTQRAAQARARRRNKSQMNGPAAIGQTDRVYRAADVVGQCPLLERIDQVTIGNADRNAGDHQPREETEMPTGVPDDGRVRCSYPSAVPADLGAGTHGVCSGSGGAKWIPSLYSYFGRIQRRFAIVHRPTRFARSLATNPHPGVGVYRVAEFPSTKPFRG